MAPLVAPGAHASSSTSDAEAGARPQQACGGRGAGGGRGRWVPGCLDFLVQGPSGPALVLCSVYTHPLPGTDFPSVRLCTHFSRWQLSGCSGQTLESPS